MLGAGGGEETTDNHFQNETQGYQISVNIVYIVSFMKISYKGGFAGQSDP